MVISRLAFTSSISFEPSFSCATFISLNPGMNRETGSERRTLPSSTRIMIADAGDGLARRGHLEDRVPRHGRHGGDIFEPALL